VFWYGVAVLAVVASYCAAGALVYAWFGLYGALPLSGNAPLQWHGLVGTYIEALLRVPRPVLLGMAGAVAGIIAAASLWRAWQLSEGGPALAHLLGARYVYPEKCNAAERRLLNVVEEMSIASRIAVPPVYVLEGEPAANALVAGYSPNEAAIIVTRGALENLSRDELQGVMGHEYSHILNGDMALNMRLACILAGLSWLGERGEGMVLGAAEANRGVEREDRGSSAIAALVGALIAFIGFPGVFAADALKAAISRERELLADAASVQYTRNPDGIAGALDSILSLHLATNVLSAQAASVSHMFFAPVVGRWWGFPTHPPIEERIRHAHPRFDQDAYRERRHGIRREVAVLDDAGNVVRSV
jgi:Zn-dependent protease with chaperone function